MQAGLGEREKTIATAQKFKGDSSCTACYLPKGHNFLFFWTLTIHACKHFTPGSAQSIWIFNFHLFIFLLSGFILGPGMSTKLRVANITN